MSEDLLQQIAGWMDGGIRGRRLAGQYTAVVDRMLTDIFAEAGNPPGLLLLATGGYGRSELAPYSDIDIMFLAESREHAEEASRILYKLWDMKLDISHSFRTPKECVEEAFRDVRTRTTLLEARYIAGSRRLFDIFRNDVYPVLAYRKQRQFVAMKLGEMEQRHRDAGDSIYMLEPNIKEGDGGLRDIHTVQWLCRVAFRIEELDGLSGLLGSDDFRRLLAAYDFMIQARYCLHLEGRRKNDVLSFEFQRAVSSRLGFSDSKKFSGPERMMRYYYLKSRIIRDMTRTIMVRCGRQYAPVFRDFTKKKINDDFALSGGKIIVRGDQSFSGRSEKIMEAFLHFSRSNRSFSNALRELINASLQRINRRTRSAHQAVQLFLEILKGPRVYVTLREMHETGVLGRFIPEFGALRSLVVHEAYHMYTVDEHTLLAVRNLEQLRTTTVKGLSRLQEIISAVPRLDVLFLAILFHDIGKAAGRRHEEEGYRRLKSVMERFNMASESRNRVEFLVRNHVLMSRIAMTRELDDPEVIAGFADAVGDIENLKAIYLITYADMSAVNPHFWNAWKASLLQELYERTAGYLAGAGDFSSRRDRVVPYGGSKEEQASFSGFLAAMPERYLISNTEARLKEDFLLRERAVEAGAAARVDVRADGIAEITVCASDSPGLFARIVGFLAMKRLNIVHGRIYTGKTGIVIDKISVANWKEVWWNGLEHDIVTGLAETVLKRRDVQLGRAGQTGHGIFDAFVEMDNETSDAYTLIEIFSGDRIGLLYDISRVLYRRGVDVVTARINTEAGLAQDIFSVRKGGGKLDNEMMMETLGDLWNVLNS